MDKSKIMKRAWEIARRFEGNGWSLLQRLAHGMKHAWYEAKRDYHLYLIARYEEKLTRLMTTEEIEWELTSLENRDFIGQAGIQRLYILRDELSRRKVQ